MPTAASSTAVARSPCWSWTRREISDVLALEPVGQRARSAPPRRRPPGRAASTSAAAATVTDDELEDVHDQEQQAEAEEPPDAGQVGGHPGEQLAGLPVAVEAHRQLLEARVEVVRGWWSPGRARRRTGPTGAGRSAPPRGRPGPGRAARAGAAVRARARAIGPSMIALVTSGIAMVSPTPASAVADHDHERHEVGTEVAAEPPQRPHPGSGMVVGTGGLGGCVRHRLVRSPRLAWRSAARHAGLVTRWSRGGWKL